MESIDKPGIAALILQRIQSASLPYFYPPIIAGDLNALRAETDFAPGFEMVMDGTNLPNEPTEIAMAIPGRVPSLFLGLPVEKLAMPDAGDPPVSDHFGLFVRWKPVPR